MSWLDRWLGLLRAWRGQEGARIGAATALPPITVAVPPPPRPPTPPSTPPATPALLQPRLPYGAIEPRPSPNKRSPRRGAKVELVVLHATAGSYESALRWLTTTERPQGMDRSSAHYLVGKTGRVAQLVEEADEAWHAGYGSWKGQGRVNAFSVGIELENANTGHDPYTVPQLEAALWLVLRACRLYGLGPGEVCGHLDVDPARKTDPAGFPWGQFRTALAAQLAGPEVST